jgi:hypothetical protein
MIEADGIGLGIIFEKIRDKESFTDDAQLYQKILSFSISGEDHQSFIKWDMCKWLKKNHKRFEKRSVVSLQQLVGRKIEKLKDLQLIHEIGTQPMSKSKSGQTPIYAFDATSYFLRWLIESLSPDPARRSGAINKIFNILYLILETDTPSSTNRFLKSLVGKIKEIDLCSHIVNHMIQLLESGDPVKDISDLINQTLIFRHADSNLANKYNELWQETLDELEPKVKELVMFRIKLFYERKMKEKAYDLAQFELDKFAAKEKFDKIVLECRCLSCPCITYEMIDLIEYTIRLKYHINGLPALEKDCPSCNKVGSLQIIDL